jgi:hypothetical protein
MQQQINTKCRNSFYQLRRIFKICKFLSRSACIQLVSAFVLSQIDYGNSLLAGLKANQLEALRKIQYAAARVIIGARRRDPMTNHVRDLHWLPVPYRIDFKIAVLTFRCLNGFAPSYLSSLISLRSANSQSIRTLRSFVVPSTPYDLVTLLHVLKLMAEGRSPTMRLLYGINYRCLSAPALPSPAFALHLKLTIFVLHIDLIYLCQS